MIMYDEALMPLNPHSHGNFSKNILVIIQLVIMASKQLTDNKPIIGEKIQKQNQL